MKGDKPSYFKLLIGLHLFKLLLSFIFNYICYWWHFNGRRIMRMSEAGLISHWYQASLVDVHQCLEKRKNTLKNDQEMTSSSNLRSMAGTFLALFAGSAISLFVFLLEILLCTFFSKY